MPRLTPDQQTRLEEVTAAHRTRVTVRADATAEAEAMIAKRVREAELAESRAVRRALDAGVPKSRVGKIGLATSDYATVGKVLALTDDEAVAERTVKEAVATLNAEHIRHATSSESVEVGHPSLLVMRIDWPGFTAEEGGDLQTILGVTTVDLHGFVYRDTDTGDWLVLRDDLLGKFAPNPAGPLQQAIDWEETLRAALERAR